MFIINDLSVNHGNLSILDSVSLKLLPGQLTVLMGPNGSGKSTLLYTLLGHPSYTIIKGSITCNGEDITILSTEKRARLGLFLVSQQAPVLEGVSVLSFLHQSYRALISQDISVSVLRDQIKELCSMVGLSEDFVSRYVHDGFSGGEKKRFEMLQLLLFKPKIALLDEIDSGLDSDAQKHFTSLLRQVLLSNPEMSILCVTHSQYLAEFVNPDSVAVIRQGKIIATGNSELIRKIELQGYNAILL